MLGGCTTSSGGEGGSTPSDTGDTSDTDPNIPEQTPIIDHDEGILTYGLYPQTHVSDETLIASLNAIASPKFADWYQLETDYYVKVEAAPYGSYTFEDGSNIVEGQEYWFKCEPIRWKILRNISTYELVSEKVLDCKMYLSNTDTRTIDDATIYPNNYEHSELRSFLNGEFYQRAFKHGNKAIASTEVNNSVYSTVSTGNEFACEDTNDYIYCLSYQEIKSYANFPNDASRLAKPTDYALAKNTLFFNNASYYWTRSPFTSQNNVSAVSYSGLVVFTVTNTPSIGVRPGMVVDMSLLED